MTWILHIRTTCISKKRTDNRKTCTTYQYGVPINDFLLARVAVIWADTPKSATEKGEKRKKEVREKGSVRIIEGEELNN